MCWTVSTRTMGCWRWGIWWGEVNRGLRTEAPHCSDGLISEARRKAGGLCPAFAAQHHACLSYQQDAAGFGGGGPMRGIMKDEGGTRHAVGVAWRLLRSFRARPWEKRCVVIRTQGWRPGLSPAALQAAMPGGDWLRMGRAGFVAADGAGMPRLLAEALGWRWPAPTAFIARFGSLV